MKLAVACALGLLAVPHAADACGFAGFDGLGAALAEAFQSDTKAVSEPVLILAGGAGDEGTTGGITVGWERGTWSTTGMFAGTSVTRVLGDYHRTADRSSVALTYGWYDNTILPLGLDLGATGQRDDDGDLRAGPLARLTVGGPVAVRLSGDVALGDSTQLDGQVEVVLDLTLMAHHTAKSTD